MAFHIKLVGSLFAISTVLLATQSGWSQVPSPSDTPFVSTKKIFTDSFGPKVEALGAELQINFLAAPLGANPISDNLIENADGSVVRKIDLVTGVLDVEEINSDGLSLFICQEIGHILGGQPYASSSDSDFANLIVANVSPAKLVSVSAQADYYATSNCLRTILSHTPVPDTDIALNSEEKIFVDKNCGDNTVCQRGFKAIKQFATLTEELKSFRKGKDDEGEDLNLMSTDSSIATSVVHSQMYFPSSSCRIQTLVNGWLGLERPSCWYVE